MNVFEWFERTIDTGLTPGRAATIDDYDLLSQEGLAGNIVMFLVLQPYFVRGLTEGAGKG